MESYYSNVQRNQLSSSIDPYYSRGDVFQRDQKYYDQVPITTRRNRTPNKSYVPIQNNQSSISQTQNQMIQNQVIQNQVVPNLVNQSGYISQNQNIVTNSQVGIIPQQRPLQVDQLLSLREQNKKLTEQLQKLTYGGEFGTGDAVIKMGHYTASKAQNEAIRQQENKIKTLQSVIKANNQKLLKYQKASSQLEIRINNIQSIDKEIYKQLKGASTRDKELLERASAALSRGENKESVLRILEQIVLN